MTETRTKLSKAANLSAEWGPPQNAGLIVGPKAPLKPKHIWEIRTRLKIAGKTGDLALFNLAIDSKLRGCDVVKLRVSDVLAGGAVRLRSTVMQQKTGRPGPFELTEPTGRRRPSGSRCAAPWAESGSSRAG